MTFDLVSDSLLKVLSVGLLVDYVTLCWSWLFVIQCIWFCVGFCGETMLLKIVLLLKTLRPGILFKK